MLVLYGVDVHVSYLNSQIGTTVMLVYLGPLYKHMYHNISLLLFISGRL